MNVIILFVVLAFGNFVDYKHIVVSFERHIDVNSSSIDSSLARVAKGAKVIERYPGALNFVVVKLADSSESFARRFISEVQSLEGVRYAEPVMIYHKLGKYTPNDPYWSYQWGPVYIHADTAWGLEMGSDDVVVAVIDEGVQYNHPDLASRFGSLVGYDFVDNDSDPMPVSAQEDHGTHVAGIIAAEIDNSVGIAGLAQVKLYSVRVLNEEGTGTTVQIANGIQWAVNAGAQILNMSLGGPTPSLLVQDACNYAWSHGALLFAAAGNDAADSIDYPARYDSVIAVTAIDPDGSIASYSNYGAEAELSAPGTNILSTIPFDQYGYMSGTSMASPHAAGVAALALSANPALTNRHLREILQNTAVDHGSPGRDPYYGYGVVDALAAVESALAQTVLDTLRNDNGIPVYHNYGSWALYYKAARFVPTRELRLVGAIMLYGSRSGDSPVEQSCTLKVWSDFSGRPGAPIASVRFTLPAIPPGSDQWIFVDLSDLNLTFGSPFWLSTHQATMSAPFLRQDNVSNPDFNKYSSDNGISWSSDNYGNYMIRAVVAYGPSISEEFDIIEPSKDDISLRCNVLRRGEPIVLEIPRCTKSRIELFDVAGRRVHAFDSRTKRISIETGMLKTGIYFLRINLENRKTISKKVIVLE